MCAWCTSVRSRPTGRCNPTSVTRRSSTSSASVSCIDQLGGLKDVDAIGIGIPGVVDAKRGVIRRAPNLVGFDGDVAFGSLIARAVDVKRVVLVNDVNAGTFAEQRVGAAKDARDVLGVFAGTGVGGALLLGGELHHGVTGAAAGIASVVNLLDLALVVVGGGVADKLGPGFVGRIEQATRARLFVPTSPVRVVPGKLGDLAGATGAALIAKR